MSTTDPGPGGKRETSGERLTDQEDMRAPGHGRPDEMGEKVGLGDRPAQPAADGGAARHEPDVEEPG